MQRLLMLTIAVLLLFGIPPYISGDAIGASAPTEREVLIDTFARVKASVGALYSKDSSGDMKFLCSATAVDRQFGKTVILTANHCVGKGVAYLINFGDNIYHTLSVWKLPHYEVNKSKFPRRYNEPETDIALFLMDGVDTPLVAIGDSKEAVTGSKIAMVGYPLGVAKISYEGIVSGYLDRAGSNEAGYLLLQIFGAPGSSGSAVVSISTGEILGVLVAAKSSGYGGGGLPVIFATPTSFMDNLMVVPGAVGSKDSDYLTRGGSDE